ncbi:uncharacterized protein LOC127583222 [Pristis pectinata]|uniref:uncharacterized protein LOC127583222 n=1 Tax=Pristis pectinata TaxID=685728 RepID=UPI00223E1F67|nr:uncharacterized protein LOC127583222 [Pristis pectinata]
MKVCTENHGLSTGLYYGPSPRSVCTGKFRQNTAHPWLDNSTRHNAKNMACNKDIYNKRLVQTNLSCASQSYGRPVVPLPPATISYRGQQSNVEHYRQKHNFRNSIRDRGNTNSTSLVKSKFLAREWGWYSQDSERNMNVNWDERFAEIKRETNKKQKNYFQGEENLPPKQLSSQDVDCANLSQVFESQYDSLIFDPPNHSLSQGDFANNSQSLKNRQSNSLLSIFKPSQTSSSLYHTMLSLSDSAYKARPVSSKGANIRLTHYPLNYLNVSLGNEREECSVNMYPDKCKAQETSKTPDCDSSLLYNDCLLNDKCSHPVLRVYAQHSSTKSWVCPPGLTCVCHRHESADSSMINSESNVSMDDCHNTSHFITSGRKTLKVTDTLTFSNKDMNDLHHPHCAVGGTSAAILCYLPTKSIDLSDCVTEMETNQSVPEDGEKLGTEDMFSNAVENRKELSEKSPDHFLDSSLKHQVKPCFPVIISNIYARQYKDTNDLWIQESAQTPVYGGLSLTPWQSNSSQGNFCSSAQKEISNLESTGVGNKAKGITPISDYSRNSTPSRGEENNKGEEEDFNMTLEDNSPSYNWEHEPILKESLKSNVTTKQLLQTFPLMDSKMLQITELRGFSLDHRTKTPVESHFKPYHERLLSHCLYAWHNSTQQRYALAVSLQERQLLRKGLRALRWAVQFTQMQKEFLERRQYRRVLAHCFNQWRDAANASQCHLMAKSSNAVGKSCSVHLRTSATLQQLLGTKIYGLWQKQHKHLQHEDVQCLSLASLHGKKASMYLLQAVHIETERAITKYRWQVGQVRTIRDCFEAQTWFLAHDVASQHILVRNHAENLESCFLHWRTLLHVKRGKKVAVLHLFQMCHAQVQQQTTALCCQANGKDNDCNKNTKYETSVQLDDVRVTYQALHSPANVCSEQTLQPQFQDWREELHKHQLARIPTRNQVQDAHKPCPKEFFEPCLQGFGKHLPLQDGTSALCREESDCSSPEQSIVQYEARPANRPDLERAGKWLQCKLEKRVVEEHLMLWAARLRQVCQVDQFHRRTLLTRVFLSWNKWRQTHQRHRELVAGFSFGRQCRVVLTLWKIRLLQKQEADRRCRKMLRQKTQKAMSHWHQYTEKRKQVQDLQARFLSVYTLRVKFSILRTWKQKAETQRNVKIMADRLVQSRYMRAWYSATLQKEKMWQKLWTFQTVRNQQVLLGAFSRWRCHLELQCFSENHRKLRMAQRVIQCWRQRTLLHQAVRHRETVLTQILFSSWKDAVRLSQLSHQFAGNIEERQLRLLLHAWAKLVKEQKDEGVRQKKVISALQHRVKQAAFHQMATLYRKQKQAVRFYHLTLLRRCLLAWVGNVHLQKHWALTVSAQVSLLQLNSAFVIWRNQLHLQRKMALFVQRQAEEILHKALRSWHRELQAIRYRGRYVSQKFVSRWILFMLARKQTDQWDAEESRAKEHNRNQLCKRFLVNWRNQSRLQQFLEKKRVEKLQEIWEQWKSFTMSKLVTMGLVSKPVPF